MNRLKLFSLALITLLIVSCQEDEDPVLEVFEGVQLFDENGNPIGCYEGCGDDWTESRLTATQRDYLTFTDIISVPQSNGVINVTHPRPFPIPLANSGSMSMLFGADQPVKFKMAVVTSEGIRRAFFAMLVENTAEQVQFDNVFFNDVPRGEVVRIYYAYFDHNNDIISEGFGDFGICDQDPPIVDVEPCFNQ